jgi:hypothetical protein
MLSVFCSLSHPIRKEQFSFVKFLREERAKKQTPYIIEGEDTFRQKLVDLQDKYLFWGMRDYLSLLLLLFYTCFTDLLGLSFGNCQQLMN